MFALLLGAGVVYLLLGDLKEALILFLLTLYQGLPEADARALTFAALVVTNLGLVLFNRARGEPFWAGLRRPKLALWLMTGGTAALLAAILAIEPARRLFHFGPLHADDVGIAIASGAVVLGLLAALEHLTHHRLDSRRSVAGRPSSDRAWSRPTD